MESKHIENVEITSYMVDYKKQLRPSNFFALAQEVAMKGATNYGFGYENLAEHDLAWVVSRTKIIFNKIPHWKEHFDFLTWHKGIIGPFFIRDYQLVAPDGEVYVNGTSSWITINTKTRSLFRTDGLSQYFDVTPQCLDNALEEQAGRIVMPKDSELIASHKVMYSDVDFVGHANNTSYVSWATDCLPVELLKESYPRVVEIVFNKETHGGEVVDIYRKVVGSENGTTVYFEGRTGDVTHFTARFTF